MAQEGFAHPEYLVDAAWLEAHKDDPNVVVVDCDVEAGYNRGLQSMVAPAWFRSASRAAISPLKVSSSAIRRRRTRLAKTLNSISAMLSQLPCLGV